MSLSIGMKSFEVSSTEPYFNNGILKSDVKEVNETEPLTPKFSPCKKAAKWCRHYFTLDLLKRRLPIIEWLPKYSIEDLKGDLIAGMTVALTVIPQGLAYASLANLDPQYGLYTAFMGCFMYTIFGSCKDLTIGPTAIMSLMTAEHVQNGNIMFVILITFLTGCIQLAMGILNLGFLVTFISSSVVSGFTSAAAITIATTQAFGIFGLKSTNTGFIDDVKEFFTGLANHEINYRDVIMGFSSIAFIFMLKYCTKLKFSCCHSTAQRLFATFMQTVSIAKNALLVLVCAGVAALLLSYDIQGLTLSKDVKPGLPPFAWPTFSIHEFNSTTNQTFEMDFLEIVKEMGTGLVILPLLCLLEAIAIAKSFSKGKKIDATQEMIAIGICNITGSLFSSYPATGSFSRTAINYGSGVRTTAGGIVTGSLVLLALGFMSPYFKYIPKSSLSALIFISVLNMVHYKDVIIMWKTNKWDLLPFSATFIFSFVLGLEYGIIFGIAVSMILLLLQISKPKIVIEERQTFLGCQYLYVHPDRTVLFPSAEKLQTKILKSIPDEYGKGIYCVLIDGEHITTADYTMAISMKSLSDSLKNENIKVIYINLKTSVQNALIGSELSDFTYFSTQVDAENFIDAISVYFTKSSPPGYSGLRRRESIRSDDVAIQLNLGGNISR